MSLHWKRAKQREQQQPVNKTLKALVLRKAKPFLYSGDSDPKEPAMRPSIHLMAFILVCGIHARKQNKDIPLPELSLKPSMWGENIVSRAKITDARPAAKSTCDHTSSAAAIEYI